MAEMKILTEVRMSPALICGSNRIFILLVLSRMPTPKISGGKEKMLITTLPFSCPLDLDVGWVS